MAANTRSMLAMAVAAIFLGGCQSKSSQTQTEPANPSVLAVAVPATQPVVAPPSDPRIDPSAVLAKRIKDYTEEMGPLADRRGKNEFAQVVATQPTLPRSEVEWARPSGTGPIKTVAKPFEPTVVPMPNPVIEHEPSVANSGATIEKSQTVAYAPPAKVSTEELNHVYVAPKPAAVAADLEAKLSKRLSDSPRDVWAHLDFQLLQFLRDEPVPQLDALTGLPIEDRELLSVVLDGLTNFRNGLRADNNMQLSKKVKPLLELADRLRSQADLNISTMSLCTKVDAFGAYVPIDPARFIAGQDHEAILYCEVENFASTSVAEKKVWETRLTQEATLYTETGLRVWADNSGKVVDRSRSQRRDFYVVKRIKLPAALSIGRYLLKVTIEDQEARRVAEQTMPVEIVAQLDPQVADTGK